MYTFDIAGDDKPALYRDLAAALDALTDGEPDWVANLANASALLWQYLPDLNWAGFYRMVGGELVLGPFQGKPACTASPSAPGCAVPPSRRARPSWSRTSTHSPVISPADAASRSELVVPIMVAGAVWGVLDLDSPLPGRFDDADAAGCEAIAALLAARLGRATA